MNQSLNTPLEQIGLKMVTMAAEQGEDMKNIIGKIIDSRHGELGIADMGYIF